MQGGHVLSLGELLEVEDLRLQLLTEDDGLAADVRWAHVSELPDPTRWLAGGELLLTTGLALFRGPAESRDYCRRLQAAGVAGLGISSGDTLPHPSVPDHLVQAAVEAGLPLIHVPEDVPLQTIVQTVADAHAREKTEALERVISSQDQLSKAAADPDGLQTVTALLLELAGYETILFGSDLRIVAGTRSDRAGVTPNLFAEVARFLDLRSGETRQIRTATGRPHCVAIGVGETPRGVLAAWHVGAPTAEERALLLMSASMMALLLELRHAGDDRARRQRAAHVRALLGDTEGAVEAQRRLGLIGSPSTELAVAVTDSSAARGTLARLISGLGEFADAVTPLTVGADLFLLLAGPGDGLPEGLEALVGELSCLTVGLGSTVSAHTARTSRDHALTARSIARARGESFHYLEQAAGYRPLIMTADRAERSRFAREVLGDVQSYDADHGSELILTLRAFLDCTGNVERTAARLGIHRHTARARLTRIAELTGRNLTHGAQLMEMWLALEIVDLDRSE
jgi:purine catabolism regulator